MSGTTSIISVHGLKWRIQKEGVSDQVTLTLLDTRFPGIEYTCTDIESEMKVAFDFVFSKSAKLALLDRHAPVQP